MLMMKVVVARDGGEVPMYIDRSGRTFSVYSQSTKLFQGMAVKNPEKVNKY